MQPETRITDKIAQEITKIEELSYELKISDVMTSDMKVVPPDTSMAVIMELFRKQRISGVPVVAENKIIGILSLEDLIRCLQNSDLSSSVQTYMSTRLITVKSLDPVVKAVEILAKTHLGRLPVLDLEGNLVGIITKGDVTRGLLHALHTRYQEEEVRRYRVSHLFEDIDSDRTSLILRYYIKPRDFTNGGKASSNIKRALLRMGAKPQIARRCGIAVYEAEMNLIIHTTEGGYIRVEIEPKTIALKVSDRGPGIPNLELARQPGYSTASEAVREMGFGAGMGLANIKRCVDKMEIESTPLKGTHLEMKIFISEEDKEGKE